VAGKIKVATCQFPVSHRIKSNSQRIQSFLQQAKKLGADIVHFPECSLSGYIGFDFPNFEAFDWVLLQKETLKITAMAGKLKLWIVLGSVHPLTYPNKPHNCLYLVGPDGEIKNRYDKRFCVAGELRRFTPGDHFVVLTINCVKCSLLICFDLRFPELYRELYKQGVKCVFQSFYNARQKGPSVHSHIMRQTMQCHAACNSFWVSMSNASGYYSPYPSCFIRPDGVIVNQLRQNRAGIMVNVVDLNEKFYDPMAGIRELAIRGRLSSGSGRVKDRRSAARTII
jgi:predicted amidohydrolase